MKTSYNVAYDNCRRFYARTDLIKIHCTYIITTFVDWSYSLLTYLTIPIAKAIHRHFPFHNWQHKCFRIPHFTASVQRNEYIVFPDKEKYFYPITINNLYSFLKTPSRR